jgi:hypothetical protein
MDTTTAPATPLLKLTSLPYQVEEMGPPISTFELSKTRFLNFSVPKATTPFPEQIS